VTQDEADKNPRLTDAGLSSVDYVTEGTRTPNLLIRGSFELTSNLRIAGILGDRE
jgi:hypothetical protein